MRCMCGTILEISLQEEGKRQGCPTCQRRFDIRFTEDVTSGQRGVSLLYLTDGKTGGETSTMGAGTTSFQLPAPGKDSAGATHGLLMEPEPPDEAHFKCACGVLLSIPKRLFEKRTHCPVCRARMLVFLIYDGRTSGFTLQSFSLIDATTGSTQVLSKL
jgi:hypothetical protein